MSDLTMIFTLMGMFSLLMLAMTIYQKKNTVPFVKMPLPRPVVWLFWIALAVIFFAFAFRAAPDVRAPSGTVPASYLLIERRTANILEPLAPPALPEPPAEPASPPLTEEGQETANQETANQETVPQNQEPPIMSMLFAEGAQVSVPEFVIALEKPARIHGYTIAYTLSSAARYYAQEYNLPAIKVTMVADESNKTLPIVIGETIYVPDFIRDKDEKGAWYMMVNQRSLLPDEIILLREMEANSASFILSNGDVDRLNLEKAMSKKLSTFFTTYSLPEIRLDPIYVTSSQDVPVTTPVR